MILLMPTPYKYFEVFLLMVVYILPAYVSEAS